jgi:uncharacterized protein (DUF1501 family)
MYSAFSDPLKTVAFNTIQTINLLQTVNPGGYVPTLPGGTTYPTNSFGTALKHTASLIKAQVGVEAVAIDYGSFDHHVNQGPVTVNGGGPTTLAGMLQTLAKGLEAFYQDLKSAPAATYTVVAMSEFGRRLTQNDNVGTDHGWANVMMLMGSQVAGGRVLSNWPGLSPAQLFQGVDLKVTIDYRDVLAEIISERLGNADNLPYVFPNYVPTMRGVLL